MKDWEKLFNNILNNEKDFSCYPRIILDMLRLYKNDWKMQSFNHPYPVINGESCYCELSDVLRSVNWLYNNGIKKFIVSDKSTACLELIYNLLSINNSDEYDYKISINNNYYQNVINTNYNIKEAVWGIVVSINKRR